MHIKSEFKLKKKKEKKKKNLLTRLNMPVGNFSKLKEASLYPYDVRKT